MGVLDGVSYLQEGQGEDLVFLHGYLACKESFAYQIACFSRFFRVTAFDFPGMGKSAPLSSPWSVGEYAAHARKVFAALGVAGFFAKSKHGLLKGYIAAVIARGAFHALGGYLYWMDYMPDNFPKSLTAVYPILYNYSYLLVEGVITVIVISIPAVAKGLARVKKMAVE